MSELQQPPIRTLIIEDNPGDAYLIEHLLGRESPDPQFRQRIEIYQASTLAQALGRLARESFDVILLDLTLPDSRGIETFSSVAKDATETPIIVLTGQTDLQVALEAIKEGAQDYLAKDKVDGYTLQRSIQYSIERQHFTRELRDKTRGLQASEARFRKMIEQNVNGMVLIDEDGVVLFMNQAAEDMLQRSAQDLIGRDYGFPVVVNIDTEIEIRKAGAESTIAEMHIVETEWEGKVAYLATLHDITDRKRVELELQQLKDFNEGIVQTMAEAVMIADGDAIITFINPAAEKLLGFAREELLGKPIATVFAQTKIATLEIALRRYARGESNNYETTLIHKDGHKVPVLVSGSPLFEENHFAGSLSVCTDITHLKSVEAQLQYDALHDSLTGLPNRALLFDRLGQIVASAKRQAHSLFAVLFMDLDHFKIINDSLGHSVGDELLVAIAKRLKACLRPADTVARLGGDEFAILLDGIQSVSDALRVADRIQEALNSPFSVGGHEVFSSASIGIALSTTGFRKPEDLLRNADIAMYRAKEKGRGQHVVFDLTMHTRALARLQLESSIRRAVDRNEFVLYYQPIIRLETGDICGLEALIRWRHPTEGIRVPAHFMDVAEETGLIVRIDNWVLQQACEQMRLWQEALPRALSLSINVNLSGFHFKQADIGAFIRQVLMESGIQPARLKLEITESAIMKDAAATSETLHNLKGAGVDIYIDDFGTGQSSLSHLHRFPVDALKIDRSFIQRIGAKGENLEIIRTIAGLAESLQIGVIAEGVETVEQLTHLKRLKCDMAQGYLFSKPVDAETARALLVNEQSWIRRLTGVMDGRTHIGAILD